MYTKQLRNQGLSIERHSSMPEMTRDEFLEKRKEKDTQLKRNNSLSNVSSSLQKRVIKTKVSSRLLQGTAASQGKKKEKIAYVPLSKRSDPLWTYQPIGNVDGGYQIQTFTKYYDSEKSKNLQYSDSEREDREEIFTFGKHKQKPFKSDISRYSSSDNNLEESAYSENGSTSLERQTFESHYSKQPFSSQLLESTNSKILDISSDKHFVKATEIETKNDSTSFYNKKTFKESENSLITNSSSNKKEKSNLFQKYKEDEVVQNVESHTKNVTESFTKVKKISSNDKEENFSNTFSKIQYSKQDQTSVDFSRRTVTTLSSGTFDSNTFKYIYTIDAELSYKEYNKLLSVINLLQGQKRKWEDEVQELKEKFEKTGKEKMQLAHNNHILRQSLDAANRAIKEINDKVSELKQTLVPLRQDNSQLRKDNDILKSEKVKFQKEVNELKTLVEVSKNEKLVMNNEIQDLKSLKNAAEEKVLQNDRDYEGYKNSMHEKFKKLEEAYRHYCLDMEKKLTKLNDEIEFLRDRNNSLKSETESLKKEKILLEEKNEDHVKTNKKLQNDIVQIKEENLSNEKISKSESFEGHRAQLKELNEEILINKEEIQKYKNNCTLLESENEKLKREIKNLENTLKDLEAKIEMATNQRRIEGQQNEILKVEAEELKKKLSDLSEVLDEKELIQKEKQNYQDQFEMMHKEIVELKRMNSECTLHMEENDYLKSELEKLKMHLKGFEELKQEKINETNEKTKLMAELQNLRGQLSILEDKQKKISSPYGNEIKAELENLRQQMKDLAELNERRKVEIFTGEIKSELENLRLQVKEMNESNKRVNTVGFNNSEKGFYHEDNEEKRRTFEVSGSDSNIFDVEYNQHPSNKETTTKIQANIFNEKENNEKENRLHQHLSNQDTQAMAINKQEKKFHQHLSNQENSSRKQMMVIQNQSSNEETRIIQAVIANEQEKGFHEHLSNDEDAKGDNVFVSQEQEVSLHQNYGIDEKNNRVHSVFMNEQEIGLHTHQPNIEYVKKTQDMSSKVQDKKFQQKLSNEEENKRIETVITDEYDRKFHQSLSSEVESRRIQEVAFNERDSKKIQAVVSDKEKKIREDLSNEEENRKEDLFSNEKEIRVHHNKAIYEEDKKIQHSVFYKQDNRLTQDLGNEVTSRLQATIANKEETKSYQRHAALDEQETRFHKPDDDRKIQAVVPNEKDNKLHQILSNNKESVDNDIETKNPILNDDHILGKESRTLYIHTDEKNIQHQSVQNVSVQNQSVHSFALGSGNSKDALTEIISTTAFNQEDHKKIRSRLQEKEVILKDFLYHPIDGTKVNSDKARPNEEANIERAQLYTKEETKQRVHNVISTAQQHSEIFQESVSSDSLNKKLNLVVRSELTESIRESKQFEQLSSPEKYEAFSFENQTATKREQNQIKEIDAKRTYQENRMKNLTGEERTKDFHLARNRESHDNNYYNSKTQSCNKLKHDSERTNQIEKELRSANIFDNNRGPPKDAFENLPRSQEKELNVNQLNQSDINRGRSPVRREHKKNKSIASTAELVSMTDIKQLNVSELDDRESKNKRSEVETQIQKRRRLSEERRKKRRSNDAESSSDENTVIQRESRRSSRNKNPTKIESNSSTDLLTEAMKSRQEQAMLHKIQGSRNVTFTAPVENSEEKDKQRLQSNIRQQLIEGIKKNSNWNSPVDSGNRMENLSFERQEEVVDKDQFVERKQVKRDSSFYQKKIETRSDLKKEFSQKIEKSESTTHRNISQKEFSGGLETTEEIYSKVDRRTNSSTKQSGIKDDSNFTSINEDHQDQEKIFHKDNRGKNAPTKPVRQMISPGSQMMSPGSHTISSGSQMTSFMTSNNVDNQSLNRQPSSSSNLHSFTRSSEENSSEIRQIVKNGSTTQNNALLKGQQRLVHPVEPSNQMRPTLASNHGEQNETRQTSVHMQHAQHTQNQITQQIYRNSPQTSRSNQSSYLDDNRALENQRSVQLQRSHTLPRQSGVTKAYSQRLSGGNSKDEVYASEKKQTIKKQFSEAELEQMERMERARVKLLFNKEGESESPNAIKRFKPDTAKSSSSENIITKEGIPLSRMNKNEESTISSFIKANSEYEFSTNLKYETLPRNTSRENNNKTITHSATLPRNMKMQQITTQQHYKISSSNVLENTEYVSQNRSRSYRDMKMDVDLYHRKSGSNLLSNRQNFMSNDSLGGYSQITYTTVSDKDYQERYDDFATQLDGTTHTSRHQDLKMEIDESELLRHARYIPKGHSKFRCEKCRALNATNRPGGPIHFCWERYFPISESTPAQSAMSLHRL